MFCKHKDARIVMIDRVYDRKLLQCPKCGKFKMLSGDYEYGWMRNIGWLNWPIWSTEVDNETV